MSAHSYLIVQAPGRKRLGRLCGYGLNNSSLCAAAPVIAVALAFGNSASANDDVPSLCESNEEIILTSVVRKISMGENVETATSERIVSICGTTENSQINQLIYRFGSGKNAEIEIRTTTRNRAKIFQESDAASHTGRVGIRFEKPPYAYEVSEGFGMSSTLSVEVYKNKTWLALFQGCIWLGCPHSSDLLSISSSVRKVAPGVLVNSKPIAPW